MVLKGMTELALMATQSRPDCQQLVLATLVQAGHTTEAIAWQSRLGLPLDDTLAQQLQSGLCERFLQLPWGDTDDCDAHIHLVDTLSQLTALAAVLHLPNPDTDTMDYPTLQPSLGRIGTNRLRYVALDSEWPCPLYGEHVGLSVLQLAIGDHAFVLDVLALPRASLRAFVAHLFADESLHKIAFAADGDIRQIRGALELQIPFVNVVELQLLGEVSRCVEPNSCSEQICAGLGP